jgi:hypothetical protein
LHPLTASLRYLSSTAPCLTPTAGDQRILYINCVALLWNIFLSTVANKAPPPPEVKSPAPAAHYQAGVVQETAEEQAISAAAMQAIPITLQADGKKLT